MFDDTCFFIISLFILVKGNVSIHFILCKVNIFSSFRMLLISKTCFTTKHTVSFPVKMIKWRLFGDFCFLADGAPAFSLFYFFVYAFDIVFWHDQWILTSGAFSLLVSLLLYIATKWSSNAVFLKSFAYCIKLASPDLTEENDSSVSVWHNTHCSTSIFYFISFFNFH